MHCIVFQEIRSLLLSLKISIPTPHKPMSTNKAHTKFVSTLLGTSSTKNIQPCINGKTLSLDFVRKRRPRQEHRVIPSRKYASASGDIYLPIPDNPLAQHVHQLALEALNAPPEHVEDIDSTQSQRPITRQGRNNRLTIDQREQRAARDQRNNTHRTVKREPKSHRSEIQPRTILGNKTTFITEQQHKRGVQSVTKRPAPSVKHQPVQQQPVTAVNVSNTVVHEPPVTPCTRSRVMFAGCTPGCELTRDTSQRPHPDTCDKQRRDDDTCHSSEQIDSSPMILTNGWSTCHTATPHPMTRDHQPSVSRDSRAHSVNDNIGSVNDTPPSTFKWQVIESMTRDQCVSPSVPMDDSTTLFPSAPDLDLTATPKQRTIQQLFQQNCYLKRRVRDLTQHLLRSNKTQFL